MKNWRILCVLIAGGCLGAAATVRAQELLISEFQADNRTGLQDEDFDHSDWIEIHNPGAAAVSLAGWYLTDDPEVLRKWPFPEVTLPAGGFLLVFASEKNRSVAGRELHANFRLELDGEFLALVMPDGTPLVSELSPIFPPQIADVSYGVGMESRVTPLLGENALVRVLVPVDDSLGSTWTDPGFDALSWTAGETGIGYDRKTPPTYDGLIRLNVEAAMYRLNGSIYARLSFTVDDPAVFDALLLRVKYEDGFIAYLNGQEVARRNALPAVTWNSRATTRHAEDAAVVYEDVRIPNPSAALRSGVNVLAFHGLNDAASSSDFLLLPVLDGVTVTGIQKRVERYYPTPTPGFPNAEGAPAVAPTPEFSPPSGAYAAAVSLTLSAPPPAAVHYTLDGSEPTEASAVYSSPLTIDNTVMVRARSFQTGSLPSPTVTQSYTTLNPNAAGFSSNLPIVLVNTFNRAPTEGGEGQFTPGTISIIESAEDGGRATITDAPVIHSRFGIKIRGSSSLQFPKKNFGMEFRDEKDEDTDVSVLGMGAESDWILLGPYTDKTLLRDYLSYDWSNRMGRWASHGKFVEVFINSSASKLAYPTNYMGVYVFLERIKRGPDRVSIQRQYASQTSEPEVTGGYIFKYDRLDPGEQGFGTPRYPRSGDRTFSFVYPKEREATAAQREWVVDFFRQYETALYGANFASPDLGFRKFIDEDAFIDHHILVELTKNIDGFRLSTFLYKDRDGKLNMGPAWDYNLCLGNANYLNGANPEGWYYPQLSEADYPWWRRLFQEPGFAARYRERWIQHRAETYHIPTLLAQIDALASTLDEAQTRNYQKWRILGVYVWPNQFIGRTYQDEINFMKDFTRRRIIWFDNQFIKPPTFNQSGGEVGPDFRLAMTAEDGDIVYTIDGTDPMTVEGETAPGALVYREPRALEQNVRVRARARVRNSWSPIREAVFITSLAPLVVTELMYNPLPPPDGVPYSSTDFEFAELQNVGLETIDLSGVSLTRAVTFSFADGQVPQIAPGEFVVVAKNVEALATRYDLTGVKVAGAYTGDLSDRGETFTIAGAVNETILGFSYQDAWYPETDGLGRSLVVLDPRAARETWGASESWRPSAAIGGSPGREDSAPPPESLQRPGDLSQDGKVDIIDIIGLLSYLFEGVVAELPCAGGTLIGEGNVQLLDFDGSGQVNVTDAVNVMNYLFHNGSRHVLGVDCIPIAGCPSSCTP